MMLQTGTVKADGSKCGTPNFELYCRQSGILIQGWPLTAGEYLQGWGFGGYAHGAVAGCAPMELSRRENAGVLISAFENCP
jgi:hypothetical protein